MCILFHICKVEKKKNEKQEQLDVQCWLLNAAGRYISVAYVCDDDGNLRHVSQH